MERRRREGNNDFLGSDDMFGGFSDFGSHRSMMSSLFGRRDPFDDPFFTRPFGSMGTGDSSRMNIINTRTDQARSEPVIEELNSDDEIDEDDKNAEVKKADSKIHYGPSTEPSVEHPDDDDTDGDEREEKCVKDGTNHNRVDGTQPKTQSYSFSKVTYGGVNGAYRTSSINRRMGNDGIIVEERKDADVTTGQAEHRVSKAIHDKGHSVTRKLNADGKVETMKTLHNLKEDELARFEETWKGNANMHPPGWPEERFNLRKNRGTGSSGQERQGLFGGLALPSIEHAGSARTMGINNGARTNSSRGRSKNIVTIPID